MHKVINQIKQQIKQLLFKFREVTKLTSQQKSPGVIQQFSHIFSHNSSLDSIIKNAHNLRVVGTLASAGLIAVMTLTVHPIINKTQSAEAAPGAVNQSTTTLTMTSGYSSAELNLTPNANGVFSYSSDDELAKFGITTNNYTGYTLSIKGSDNTQQLTNSTTSTSLDSITSVIDSSTFDTNTYNGKWGYRPSKYNSVDNASFRPAPTTSASTLDVTSSANTSDTNEYTIGLGARADMSTPAGTYTNTFILTAVGNPIVYTINYSKGDITDTVSNLPTTQSGSVSTASVTLSSTTPTRTNYTFLYWCLGDSSQSASEIIPNNATTCNGTTYNAGASFGIDQTMNNTTTLYAVWSPNITIKTATGISKVTLNGTETSSTSGTTVTGLIYGQSYTLTASTSTGYTFSSWPSLSGASGSIANTASSSTTYTVGSVPVTITPTATANKYNITLTNSSATTNGSTSAYTTYNSSNVYAGTSSASGTSKITNPSRGYSFTGFTMGTNASGLSPNFTNASTNCKSTTSCKNSYTFNGWYTATSGGNQIINTSGNLVASTSYANSSSQWTYHTASSPALTLYAQWGSGTSITLPTISKTGYTCSWNTNSSGTGTKYTSGGTYTPTANQALYGICTINSYTITLSRSNADAIVIDGTSRTGSSISLTYGSHTISGTYPSGYEFSSWTTSNSTNLAIANTSSASTSITVHGAATLTLNGKQSCQSTVSGTMQAFNPCSSVANGTSGTLTDSRDNQNYTVAKINNQWWMTKNLNIAGGTTLTSSDSNVSAKYTLPASSTSGFLDNSAYVYNSGSTSCGNKSPCYSYYSYRAAAAGANPSSGEASSDICPKGWRLPTSANLNTLKSSYSTGAKVTASPFLGVYAGYYISSSFYDGGSAGDYWSSTANDSGNAYRFEFENNGNNASVYNDGKGHGNSVRCVLK